jgi:branched-chain amino acid transport system substrate-binding protein
MNAKVVRVLLSWVVCLGAIAPALAADPIVVGRSLPLTGPLKSYGEAKRDGADAFIKKVNAAGGIGGRAIELVTLDDNYQPPRTVENLKKLAKERQPTAFLGLFGVPTVAAALPVLEELKIPAVGLTSGTDALRTPHRRYVFPVRASYADEARKLVGHVKVVNITRIAVLFTDNPFGKSVKDSLLAALRDGGLTATPVQMDAAAKDVSTAVRTALASEPQAVFLTMLSQAAVPSLKELRNSGFRGSLYTFSPVDTSTITKELGQDARGLAITQIVPIPVGTRIKVVAEYVKALADANLGSPSFYGLEAFIEAKVLVEGLRRSGPGATPGSLVTALETLNDLDVGGYYVRYRPGEHAGSTFVEIDVIDSKGAVMR